MGGMLLRRAECEEYEKLAEYEKLVECVEHLECADRCPGFFLRSVVDVRLVGIRLIDALLFALFIPGIIFFPYQAQAGWDIYTIQSVNSFIYWAPTRSIALDSKGQVHLAYGSGTLKYAHSFNWQGNMAWIVESLHSAPEAKGFDAIALDASNSPHICYNSDGDLIYAHRTASGWIFKTIAGKDGLAGDDTANVGASISMALDSQGAAHICYYDCSQQKLKYIDQSLHESLIELVDDSGEDVGRKNSIALDSAGNVHIAYFDWSKRDLKYACKQGDVWSTEVVDSEGDVGDWPALAIDRDGLPHISYCDWTNKTLKYACRSSEAESEGKWTTETVDSSDKVGGFTSIALDNEGRAHICYFNWSAHALMYAFQDGETWRTEMVNRDEDIDGSISLALDSAGQKHIVYYNFTTNSLKYVRSQQDPAETEKGGETRSSGGSGNFFNGKFGCFLSAVKALMKLP